MKISEVFFSVQGEGPNIGTPAIFVRLGQCNLECIFCDTKYALQNWGEMTIEEIIKEIKKFQCKTVVFTGGEPLLQQKELAQLMERLLLKSPFYFFEIETNGSIEPNKRMLELVDSWVVSPKLSNAGVKPYKVPHAFFDNKRGDINLKFVVDSREDLDEIYEYLNSNKDFSYLGPEGVFLMPQAITVRDHNRKLPFIIEFAKKYGCRVSPRLQILAFGNKRGV